LITDDKGEQNTSLLELLTSGKMEDYLLKAVENIDSMVDDYKKLINNIDWNRLAENLNRLAYAFYCLPTNIQNATKTWASYKWIPSLPTYNVYDFIKNLNAPKSQDEADKVMLENIDEETLTQLIESISEHIPQYGQNKNAFSEAVECYNSSLYNASVLLLYSIIDSIFIKSQKKSENLKLLRKLANKAVDDAINKEKSKYSIIAFSTKNVVEELFKNAKDFTIDEGLNRNMLCHGMTDYIPNKIDCLKLIVLIYNIYLLFDTNFFTWKSETTESTNGNK